MKTLEIPSTLRDVDVISLLSDVPYYSQLDNKSEPYRTCNVSSCAMAVESLKPGLFSGDDDYYRKLYPYGDTTDHSAHSKMLRDHGIESSFSYKLHYYDLSASLKEGKPVVIGVLHRGTLSAPTGGHMICVIGEYKDGFIGHDPFGKPFAYRPDQPDGSFCLLPYQSLNRRWLCEGPGSGWGRMFL